MNHPPEPIFLDNTGRRWKKLRSFFIGLILAVSLVGAAFSISIFMLPMAPLSFSFSLPKLETHEQAARRFLAQMEKNHLKHKIADENKSGHKYHKRGPGEPYSIVAGFFENWDENSFRNFKAHANQLTCVIPDWMALTPDGKSFTFRKDESPTSNDSFMECIAREDKLKIYPMLDNVITGKGFDWLRLKNLLAAPDDDQLSLVEDLRDYLVERKYDGINIDFEPNIGALNGADFDAAKKLIYTQMPRFIKNLKSVFKPAHLVVSQDLMADDPTINYEALGDLNDFVVVMMYDQHYVGGEPGPIASQEWIEKIAQNIFSKIDSSKVVLGLENECYDWKVKWNDDGTYKANGPAEAMAVMNGVSRARFAGAKIQMDEDELNPYFYYTDSNDQDHLAYMLDAITAYNQIRALKGYKPAGAALWYLGCEDPDLWVTFNRDTLGEPVPVKDFTVVVAGSVPEGHGEISEVEGSATIGERALTADSDGLINTETYTKYPEPYIQHQFGDVKREIALTFDDGPDPRWTPQILAILKQKHAPATFFIKGVNADRWQSIVKQEWNQGHEIGNHTYFHPHLKYVSIMRAEFEVNATQRLIESITGHSTRLFRPPYAEGSDPDDEKTSEMAPLLSRIHQMGYIMVGMFIDPTDWDPDHKTYQSIVDLAISQSGKGHILLLHDGGDDRRHTVQALPHIIDDLRAKGYKLVKVSDLCKGVVKGNLFPPVPMNQDAIIGMDWYIFEAGFWLSTILQITFFIAMAVGVLRILIMTTMALIHRARSHNTEQKNYTPALTVIVPGYNEEKVICRTIDMILGSDYPDLRVIAVDDGSTDDTERILRERFADDPRVVIVRKENGGKSSALNLALEMAHTEIVVCVDADTIIAPDAIRKLARHFINPKVGAVAGNIKVGNRTNPLAVWQSLEYITSQNFDRRAYAQLDSVPVIPGALGAWRRSAILEAGGYDSSTLAEDTDLTFRVRLLGYSTQTENEALAFTEAPDNVKALSKQRFRWAFGILQALWKHKDLLFKKKAGAMGCFVMPSMWVFSVGFQMLAPVVDIAVIWALVQGRGMVVLMYWAVLFILDLLASLVAFGLDNEDPRALVWLFWQRFFYRQFMYYIIWKSLVAALKGHSVGWGKLQRKNTAQVIAKKTKIG